MDASLHCPCVPVIPSGHMQDARRCSISMLDLQEVRYMYEIRMGLEPSFVSQKFGSGDIRWKDILT